MSHSQLTTWRRYTAVEKKAYRARQLRRGMNRHALKSQVFADIYSGRTPDPKIMAMLNATATRVRHHFADNLGSRAPTVRVNGDVL